MDRNRFFMWAYIIFIVTAAILRIHVEFSAWNPIVVGISISSVFFSAEDLSNRISKYYDEYFSTNQNVIDKIKEEFEKSRESAQYAEHIVKLCEDIELNLPDTFLSSIRTNVPPESLEKDVLLEEKRLIKIKKCVSRIRMVSTILTFLGFFSLFIPLIVLEYYEISSLIQEMITVGAFVLILFTQLISGVLENKLRIERNDCNELMGSILEAIRDIDKDEELLNDINCIVKKIVGVKLEDKINNLPK